MNDTMSSGPGGRQERRSHVPREGSHGVQWGLAIALVLVVVITGVVAWKLGSSNQLVDTAWTLTDFPEADVELGSYVITAAFSADEITGQAPVNGYSGEYSAGGAVFKVGDVTRTLVAGTDDAMAVETAYFDALGGVTAYVFDGETLTLLDPDGRRLLYFERAR